MSVSEQPPTKCDEGALLIADWKHEAAAELVKVTALRIVVDEKQRLAIGEGKAFLFEVDGQSSRDFGSVSDFPIGQSRFIQPSAFAVLAGDRAFREMIPEESK